MENGFEKIINVIGTKSNILSSYCFYESLLPQISSYAHSDDRKLKPLILDFEEISDIDPLVLPNLFTVGIALKRRNISAVQIRNLNKQTYQMLKNSGFIEWAENEEIFYFYDKDAYYDSNNKFYNIGKNLFLYYKFPMEFKNYKEEEFEKNPRLYQSIVNYVYGTIKENDAASREKLEDKEFKYTDEAELKSLVYFMENEVARFFKTIQPEPTYQVSLIVKYIIEVIKNSFMHGQDDCAIVLSLKEIFIDRKKRIQVKIAISDIGTGITNYNYEKYFDNDKAGTITEKKKKGNYISVFNNSQSNIFRNNSSLSDDQKKCLQSEYSDICDSIFYRAIKRENTEQYWDYGLFDIVKSVTRYPDAEGVVRIHSSHVQIIMTNKFYETYIQNCLLGNGTSSYGALPKMDWDKLVEQLQGYNAKANEKTNVRTTNKFKGSHIEVEFKV